MPACDTSALSLLLPPRVTLDVGGNRRKLASTSNVVQSRESLPAGNDDQSSSFPPFSTFALRSCRFESAWNSFSSSSSPSSSLFQAWFGRASVEKSKCASQCRMSVRVGEARIFDSMQQQRYVIHGEAWRSGQLPGRSPVLGRNRGRKSLEAKPRWKDVSVDRLELEESRIVRLCILVCHPWRALAIGLLSGSSLQTN